MTNSNPVSLEPDAKAALPPQSRGVRPRGKAQDWLWVVVAMLLCSLLAAWNIGRASLWNDEIFSRYYQDLFGLHYLLTYGLKIEPTPPTYYILLHEWMRLFGTGEGALRSLSLVCYVAALPFVFLLGREIGSRRSAIAGAFLFAVSPMGIYFAQEARVYAMTVTACSVVVWAVAVFLRDPRDGVAIVSYVIAGTACLYLHGSMPFFLAASGLCVSVALLAWREGRWLRRLLTWAVMNMAVLLLSLPYTHLLLSVSHQGGLAWLPPLTLRGVVSVLSILVAGILTPRTLLAVPLTGLVFVTLAVSLVLRRPSGRALLVTVAIPVVFMGLVCAVSLVRPILLPRILCWMIVPLSALAGRQIVLGWDAAQPGLRARWPALGVAGAVGLASFVGLYFLKTSAGAGKEPWREAFAEMLPHAGPGDLLVISPEDNALIPKYYAPRLGNLRIWHAGLPDTIMTPAHAILHVSPITQQEIERAIAAGQHVWLMSTGIDEKYADLLKAVAAPSYDRKWSCINGYCVEITGWGKLR